MSHVNGNVYNGEWKNDKMTFGKMEYAADESAYTGYWYEG